MKAILKHVAKYIPEEKKPQARALYGKFDIRTQAVKSRRRVVKAERVEFLDLEIAHLEPYEFLSPAAGEIQVRTHCTLVSPGTETAVLCGLPGVPRGMFPFPPGYSNVGTIEAVGSGMGHFRVGQRVAGRMSHCSRGIMTSISLFAVPDEVSDEQACFMELGIIGLQGVRHAGITPGTRVAVLGQGIIGQMANRLSRVCGASWVGAIAHSRNRATTSLQNGWADEFIALKEAPALREIGADVVIEAVGTPGAVLTAMECARDGGTVVLLGSARGLGRNIDIYAAAQQRRLTMVGAHISMMPDKDISPTRYTYAEEGRLFLELLRRKRLEVADLITWRARPSECNHVYEVLARGGDRHVGVMFDWRESPAAQNARG